MPPCPQEPALPAAGRREYVEFPEWGIGKVRAKVDTGARTSALGVARYELERNGEAVKARLHLRRGRRKTGEVKVVETPVVGMAIVKNSGGTREQRPVVEATVRLGPVEKRIRLTVTDRTEMLCSMLLGREALCGSFVVDVRGKYLLRG
jgi:hypothetical protein